MTNKQTNVNLDEYEEYTQKEIEYIDKYKKLSGDAMDDEEIFDLVIKYDYDDKKIRDSILDHIELLKKKGEEYTWTLVEKGKKQKVTKPQEPVKESRDKRNFRPNTRYQDEVLTGQNYENTYSNTNYRGQRGGRRGNYRGGRGRGGNRNRRPFQEAVEINQNQTNQNVQEEVIHVNEINEEKEIKDTLVTLNVDSHVQTNLNNDIPKNNLFNNEEIKINNNKIQSPLHNHQNEIHNNPSSIFTIERENENILTKLLEEKKPDTPKTKQVEQKSFLEDYLNHFNRNLQISQALSYHIKSNPKIIKHTISQQPQINYNQTQTPQPSISTNKNYPQKSDRFNMSQQQQHLPQDYMNFQQNAYMNPYQQMMYMMMNPYMYHQMPDMENPNVDPLHKNVQKPKNAYPRENDLIGGYGSQMGPYQGFPMIPQNYFPQSQMGGMPDNQGYYGVMDKTQMHKNQDLGENPNPNPNFYGNFYNK